MAMTDTDKLAAKIEEISGSEHVEFLDRAPSDFSVDGLSPAVVVAPGSEDEVSAILSMASEWGLGVVLRGAGTKMSIGNAPNSLDIVLSMRRLEGIREYDHENLSVSVGAGATLAGLGVVLREKKQFLPLDPLFHKACTVGGTIASGSSGPSRFKYGSPRDLVLGIRGVLPTGRSFKFGGKVTKNVAGYDMTKLFIGSYGTIGAVTEATFKLFPLPEAKKTALVPFPALGDAAVFIESVLDSYLEPTSIDILNPGALGVLNGETGLELAHGYVAAIGLEGFTEAVKRQVDELGAMADGLKCSVIEGREQELFWSAVSDFAGSFERPVRLKAGAPISSLLSAMERLERDALEMGFEVSIIAHAGSGVAFQFFNQSEVSPEQCRDYVLHGRRLLEGLGGYLTVEEAPLEVKERLPVWGDVGGGIRLMREIKSAFDPACIMAPGRFL